MEEHEVVNDVIDTVPPHEVEVNYSSGAVVKLGNELTPTQVKDPPIQVKWPTENGTFYTLCMTDPDAPSRQTPEYREILHWLIVNIPNNDIGSGETITEYVGSGPRKDTGLHRYVFLVYKQPDKINPDEKRATKTSREGRRQFHIRNFAKKYNLGEPIAGNFYQAQWDDYVAKLHEQFSSK